MSQKNLTGTRKNKVDKALHDPRIRKILQDRERKAFEGGGIVLIMSTACLKRQLNANNNIDKTLHDPRI